MTGKHFKEGTPFTDMVGSVTEWLAGATRGSVCMKSQAQGRC